MQTKSFLFLFFLLIKFVLLAQTPYDTLVVTYDFNKLKTGNLNNIDNWKTSISGTTTDIQIKAAHSHDSSNALYFPQNGGGVNGGMNRPMDSIFPKFDFSDTK